MRSRQLGGSNSSARRPSAGITSRFAVCRERPLLRRGSWMRPARGSAPRQAARQRGRAPSVGNSPAIGRIGTTTSSTTYDGVLQMLRIRTRKITPHPGPLRKRAGELIDSAVDDRLIYTRARPHEVEKPAVRRLWRAVRAAHGVELCLSAATPPPACSSDGRSCAERGRSFGRQEPAGSSTHRRPWMRRRDSLALARSRVSPPARYDRNCPPTVAPSMPASAPTARRSMRSLSSYATRAVSRCTARR